jgi:hypothetical protein
MVSFLLHVALLVPSLDWLFPAPERPLPEPFILKLTLRPAPQLPPPPPPAPPPVAPPIVPPAAPPIILPIVPPQASATETAPPAQKDSPPPPAEAPAPPAVAAPPAAPPEAPSPEKPVSEPQVIEAYESAFPPQGEMVYTVYRGTQGFEIGYARQQWEIRDGRYRFTSLMETTGLAALFRSVRVETESAGWIDGVGFHPETYWSRNSRSGETRVAFDWTAWQVRVGEQPPEPLVARSQDLLSLNYQFAYTVFPTAASLRARSTFDIWVATGKKYEPVRFDILGPEELELPVGVFQTLHLQSMSDTQTELWIAPDYLMLPIKIRFTDKDGDTYEQVIREFTFTLPEGEEEAEAPASAPEAMPQMPRLPFP